MDQEKHFGGDAMQGNRLHKGYQSIREKDYTLTKCFEGEPELREKFNLLWYNISEFDTFISLRKPTEDQTLLYKIKLKIYWLFMGIAPNFYL